ncbi:hypothetical protein [Gordonia sp. SL306]|uniref:hypothetical protein n=1 Tax=Gordonia sp. SL306 TaxID=2995145 RepID=UPI00226E2B73|nr:hypothetical protein [Gordonia sp. SL306]WAC56692.1 hypothetical protein OVA31_05380 [Gordonia sp. SL306]
MAPQNPRPPRKKTARKPYTPRVAGSGQRPTDAVPETEPKAADPVDSTTDSADSTADPVDSTTDPADSTTDPADSTTDPADSTTDPAESTEDPADSTTDPVEKPKPAGKTRPVARVSTLRTGDAASSTARAVTADKNATSTGKPSTSSGLFPFSRRAIGILIGVAVVLGIFALIAGLHPGASISSNKAFVDQPATTELTSQVQSKACSLTVNTLDVDKWAGEARSVLTGNARSEFDKYLPQQRDILNQTKQVADCRVESVGVADLSGGGDGATARVVANLIVSQKQAGIAGQSAAPRYQFSMVKHGDDWLISQVEAF